MPKRKKKLKSTCDKVPFESEKDARQSLFDIVENMYKRKTTPCRYYLCKECGKYHLTSNLEFKKY